ncbi:putative acyl-CoA dehydrogenase [bacterium HR08]|nr:putative acyl-CoA dehydrogenase [bacterium HR08]
MTRPEDERIKGGSFLIREASPEEVFTPEDFTDEHRMIARTAEEFMEREVVPQAERIEHQDLELMVELLRRAAEVGLLAAEIPERYGGLGLDKVSAMIISEKLAANSSFAVSHGGHTGIGTAPIVLFGTVEQKRKYLPKLASGEWFSAYALTEPEAGSDALAGKTRADLAPDGRHYLLNGSKMWITNAGFAHIFITFAKVNGEHFSCFIVHRDTPGLTIGPEEKKMGIKGSSTRALLFENARVPAENLLGEIGKGHKIAFNVLNLGRLRLGASCVGGCKIGLTAALQYAKQRRQFGRPICEFGLIKQKLSEMAIRTWVAESAVYRTAGLIDAALSGLDEDDQPARMRAVEEYAIECAINKIVGSEFADYVADEAVQIFGGNGYSAEYPVERYYRDARINRIFEGTNEINRLLITGMLLRRALSGHLPLLPAIQRTMHDVLAPSAPELESESPLEREQRLVAQAKKIVLLVAGAAAQKYRERLTEEQEIVGAISDMVIEVFLMESALLRALKLSARRGPESCAVQQDIARTYIHDAMGRIEVLARQAVSALAEGDELRLQLAALRRLSKFTPMNTIAARRRIADALIQAGRYMLSE